MELAAPEKLHTMDILVTVAPEFIVQLQVLLFIMLTELMGTVQFLVQIQAEVVVVLTPDPEQMVLMVLLFYASQLLITQAT